MFCCSTVEKPLPPEVVEEISHAAVHLAEETVACADLTFSAARLSQAAQATPAAKAAPDGRPLRVLLEGARGLRRDSWQPGDRKPCVAATVAATGGGGGGFRTPAAASSFDPMWGHEGRLSNVTQGATLELVMWDEDPAGPRTLLARASLPAQLYEPRGFAGEVPLCGVGLEAFLKVRVAAVGQAFPPGLGCEFQVTLEKAEGKMLGLEVDVLDKTTLHITGVSPEGLVALFNEGASDAERVSPGLYVVAVNGAADDAAAMVERLRADQRVTLTLRRPQLFHITVTKEAAGLGLDLDYATGGTSLLLLAVGPGPVADWSAANPALEVRRYDRIVAVSGTAGGSRELFDALVGGGDRLRLLMSRPAPLDWPAWR